jgi:fatty acid desaturase
MISKGADPDLWTDEEEQRDESSGRESENLAARIKPDALKSLYGLDLVRSILPLVGTWSLISASIAIALWSHSIVVWLAAIVIVGRSQHALAVLMHDAAHFRLAEDRALNDFLGQWLCAFPIASNLYAYRKVHLRHHRYLLTDRDPDLSLSRPYPVVWSSFRRKLLRDAAGISALVMRGYLVVEDGRTRLSLGRFERWSDRETNLRRAIAATIIATLFACGYGLAFLALWILPLLVVYQVILRVRGVLEHGAVDANDGLRNARTVVSPNPFARFLLGPHHVSYHLEHHLYPGVPHYNLPALHRALAEDPRFARAMVTTSYLGALRDCVRPDREAEKLAA